MRLARVALEAALGVDGVTGADSGNAGLLATFDGLDRLSGVLATADQEDKVSISLNLVVSLVPLRPLADRVRASVVSAAGAAGLGQSLGPVDIVFADVAEGA